MDRCELKANVLLELRGPDGRVKERREFHNTVKTAGKEGAADQLLLSPSLNKPTHMAIGTGTPGATALGTEVDRNALTASGCSKTRSGAVVTMVGFWDAGDPAGTNVITEAGVFDAASTGNMWLSATVSPSVSKASGDTLTLTWTLTVG